MAVAGATFAAEPACKDYARELAAMVSVDAAMRSRWDLASMHAAPPGAMPRVVEQTQIVDRNNTRRLKSLVRRCGWPESKRDGRSAVDDVWLIVQHADHDRGFQRRFLQEVERRLARGEGSATQMAYLSDRLDAADKRPQRFGTQLEQTGRCNFEFALLDDRTAVEARRKALGWPGLDEYKRLVHQNLLPADCP
jgi:hypothetical protein